MQPNKNINFDWQAVIDGNRIGLERVFESIKAGSVDEEDFKKLRNFVQFSFALMQLSGSKNWGRAKVNAELMDFLKDDE